MGFIKAKPAPPAPRPGEPAPAAWVPITTLSPELNSAMEQQAKERNDKTRARASSAGTRLGEGDGQKISKKLLGN